MKTSKSLLSRLAAGMLVVSLFAVTLIPGTASAQSITYGASKADCVAKQSAITDIATLKEYGGKRIANREKSLNSFNDEVLNKRYINLDKQFDKAKKSADKQAKTSLNVAKPANHKEAIILDRTNIANALEGQKQALNAATTPAQVATVNCSVVWDLRIASYIAPKLKFQLALDTYSNTNAINSALYGVAQNNGKTGSIKNPTETANVIAKLQQQLDMITISNASAETGVKVNPLDSKASSLFNPMKNETKVISTELKSSSKSLVKATKEVTKEQKASKAKETPTTSKPSASTKKEVSDKAKANRAAAPAACKGTKGANKVASQKEAQAACEYGFKTTGPSATRQKACNTKFNKSGKQEKKNLLTTACNAGIELRS